MTPEEAAELRAWNAAIDACLECVWHLSGLKTPRVVDLDSVYRRLQALKKPREESDGT